MRMNRRWPPPILAFLALLIGAPTPAFAQGQVQITVMTSGGFSAAFRELQPEFEKASGVKVAVTRGASQGTGPDTIGAQLHRGVPADVVIMSREGLDDLTDGGGSSAEQMSTWGKHLWACLYARARPSRRSARWTPSN
jgi:spermidine/putrescine-binding protein